MLQNEQIKAFGIEVVSGGTVIGGLLRADGTGDLGGVIVVVGGVLHGDHLGVVGDRFRLQVTQDRAGQAVREGADAAGFRWVVPE